MHTESERQTESHAYYQRKRASLLLGVGIDILLFIMLLLLHGNILLQTSVRMFTWQPVLHWFPLQDALAYAIIALLLFLISLPLQCYSGFFLPRQYDISVMTRRAWLTDQLKGFLLSGVLGLLGIELFYLLLVTIPQFWWVVFAGIMFLFTIVLANLAPTLLLPIFYKLTPLPEGTVRDMLLALAERAQTPVQGVYTMQLSEKTKAANASVMGLGNTRRIVLGDTLLAEFAHDEIEVVIAHELGHQVHHDIWKLLIVSGCITLAALYILSLLFAWLPAISLLGLQDTYAIAALPYQLFLVSLIGMLLSFCINVYTRRIEIQADAYALQLTKNAEGFIRAMQRLANQNLLESDPPVWAQFFLYDHPSIGSRIRFAKKYIVPAMECQP